MSEPYNSLPIAEVHWYDTGTADGWTSKLAEIGEITSVGYVIKDNDQGILLLLSRNWTEGHTEYGCNVFILRSTIRKTQYFRGGPKKDRPMK